MKRFFSLVLCLGLPFLGALSPSLGQGQSFEAGVGHGDITPEVWPLKLRGSFNPKDTSSAHDPLSARALAVRNGEGRAVIVTVDNVGVNRETLDSFKQSAAQVTGWKPEEMLIAATHSHSAPSMSGGEGPNGIYQERARAGVVEAIREAVQSLQPARVGFGSDEVPDEVFNRRWYLEDGKMPLNPFGKMDTVKMNPGRSGLVKPAAPTDPEVAVIDIRNSRGRGLSILCNYALHYVGNVPGRQASADYFGEFCRIMGPRMRGADPGFLALMSNGASGDINNIDFTGTRPPRAPFEQIRQVATKVADAAWRATLDIQHDSKAPVAMLQREVTLRYRKPDAAGVEWARKVLAMSEEEMKDQPRLAKHYAARSLRNAEFPDTVDVIIQAIRIGDQAIVSLPFEVLVEIGMEIKEKSPFPHTMIISLANGSYGYLPTPKQHGLGGYETWLGTCNVDIDSSEILTKNLLEMLESLKP